MQYIAFDTETALIATGRKAPPLACMTSCVLWEEPQIFDKYTTPVIFERWLRDNDVTLVAHNAKFDFGVMQENYPWLVDLIFEKFEKGLIRCTMINRIMDAIGRGVYQTLSQSGKLRLTLADLVLDVLGEIVEGKRGDTWRFKYRELIDVVMSLWPQLAVEYAKKDAWYTIRVFHQYKMEEPLPDELCQVKYAYALHLMYSYGFIADPVRTKALEKKLLKSTKKWGAKLAPTDLCTWLDKEQRYKDNQAPQRALVIKKCKAAGIMVPRGEITDKMKKKGITEGNVKLKKDFLETLPCEGDLKCDFDEEIVCQNKLHWVAFIKADKGELSKYVKWLKIACEEPVSSRFSSCIATGRISVSGPPTQQFPRRAGCRECIQPREGSYFIGADYSSNELVTLGQVWLDLFGESKLAELLQQGVSLHDYTGAIIMGLPYDEFLARRKAGDKECKKFRQLSKCLNFGLPGGMGAEKFVDYCWDSWRVRITVEEARYYKKCWLSWFPEAKKYFGVIGNRVQTGGGVFRYKQPVSGRMRGGLGYCDGCNTSFQGLAADMTKNALWWVTRECFVKGSWEFNSLGYPQSHNLVWVPGRPSPLHGCKPILFMHDEIILEVPRQYAVGAAERLAFLMDNSSALYCPDVPGKAEPWITDHWYKDAETVRDSEGVLQLWTP